MSYQKFETPEQLADLLQNDLAVLLSERFAGKEKSELPQGHGLPAMRNATIGRDRERAELAELLLRKDIGLVTLTGTGGTGKSHLALRVAHDVAARFPDGACYVSLASVGRAEQVLPTIAAALCVVDSGQGDLMDALAEQLGDREPLVLIDNFEQVLEAAPLLATLLSRLPKLTLLVTSRAPLHLLGEQVFAVQPLDGPATDEQHREKLLACPSVDLFVQRARARAAQLELDDANVRAIADLCRHLEGLPLAIELAAAHTKYFTPAALAARTDRLLDLLARGLGSARTAAYDAGGHLLQL
ncbi:MAG: AAA family ATPase [Flavobacteriales bacterium]|nr:AAA family ATPase [Flavobacteriales bacterium]